MAIDREKEELTDEELIAGIIETQIQNAERAINDHKETIEYHKNCLKKYEEDLALEKQRIRVIESLRSAHKQINE